MRHNSLLIVYAQCNGSQPTVDVADLQMVWGTTSAVRMRTTVYIQNRKQISKMYTNQYRFNEYKNSIIFIFMAETLPVQQLLNGPHLLIVTEKFCIG